MIDYIWLNDQTPILTQISDHFQSAAILFHPFILMPSGWREKNKYKYLCDEEVLKYGKPIGWKEVMYESGLCNLKELALAMKTSIGAL